MGWVSAVGSSGTVTAIDDDADGQDAPHDDLALALMAFVQIEAPKKDDFLALASAAGAPTEVFGMKADAIKAHMLDSMEVAKAPLMEDGLPWSFEDWAQALRDELAPAEIVEEPTGGEDNEGE